MYKKAIFLILFCVTACGHTGREHAQIIEFVRQGNLTAAQQLAGKKDFYADKPSLLARYFEIGTLHYLNGEYYQALQNFDKAHELSRKLYTKSVSKSVAAQIAGDGLAPYTGEKYELSLLRFYQSLTHYKLYEQGYYESYMAQEDGETRVIERKELSESEKRLHFNAARASILDWNSLLTTFTNESGNKDAFKQDMLAKTWGAEIHDIYGSSGDRQIARQLYKDARKLLDTAYADYPSYTTKHGERLKQYAAAKGKDLYAGPDKKENVKIILKTGLITPKIPEKVDIRIPLSAFLFSGSKDNFVSCLSNILPGQRISFEIPAVSAPEKAGNYQVVVTTPEGKKAAAKPMVLTAPVSETAYREYKNKRGALIAEKSARLTAKYAAAAVSACAVYDPNDAFKWLAAYAAFAASAKLIEASEYADVRYWGLLPNAVFQQSLFLKKGSYNGEIRSNGQKLKTFSFTVDESRPVLIDLNIPNS